MNKITQTEEIVMFHFRLGVAIAQWSYVENAIRHIVVACFENDKLNREAIALGYFKLEGFRAKLAFADGVVSRKLAGSKHAKDWEKLVSRADTQSRIRNRLAHWNIGKYWHRKEGTRVVLSPWTFPKPKNKPKKPVPPPCSLRIYDIHKIDREFRALTHSLQNFLARICELPEPHAKADERATDVLTIHNLVTQTREVFAAPPLSSKERRRLASEANAKASLLVDIPNEGAKSE